MGQQASATLEPCKTASQSYASHLAALNLTREKDSCCRDLNTFLALCSLKMKLDLDVPLACCILAQQESVKHSSNPSWVD